VPVRHDGVVIPVVTPDEMGAIDAAAPEPEHVLVARAGAAVVRAAVRMLGGTYGRRVIVVAGKGNNGADGRVAAERLRSRGVRVDVLEADRLPDLLDPCDLVIDAAYGTGMRGTYVAPTTSIGTPVLAVDIPSGVDGFTGAVADGSHVLPADRTVTFAAYKPGLLLGAGAELAGEVEVADIGLVTDTARAHLVTDADVHDWLPAPAFDTNKWRTAVWVVAGSPGMDGAAALVAAGAQRAGAGYVRLSMPSGDGSSLPYAPHVPVEVVRRPLAATGWWADVRGDLDRFGALVVGNGLGLADGMAHDVRSIVAASTVPTVVDADALTLLGTDAARVVGPHVVVTPHDGEFARLAGGPPGADRIAAARDLAADLGCTVLLKGPCTVVAAPDGQVLLVATGDARLATAGTGDVLAGVIGALCARGLDPWLAAAAAAHLHGRAGALGWRTGGVASDLPALLPVAVSSLATGPHRSTSAAHQS